MPSLVRIRIEKGKDLPPMDRNAAPESATDAYVEVKLEKQSQRTSTCRRTLNPVWSEEFQFDFVDDSVMQDEPLELRCMDQDLYSSKLIGVTYIDLNPLIMRTTNEADKDLVISGWFPLFDTARGVRGSIYVTVKLQFIGNENPFLDSSAGIQFFSASNLSTRNFFVQEIIGFVDELVVQDDPENRWQGYFIKNKTSNDNRMKALYCLSSEVRRKLGKKVFELGGNAVLGYSFALDTEGVAGIIARATGTACRLLKVDSGATMVSIPRVRYNFLTMAYPEWQTMMRVIGKTAVLIKDHAEVLAPSLVRASSSSTKTTRHEPLILLHSLDERTITATQVMPFALSHDNKTTRGEGLLSGPNRILLAGKMESDRIAATGTATENANNIFHSEVQLLTLTSFPAHVAVKFGGLVLARSVKYLSANKGETAISDEDTKDDWWKELREEIKSHAKSLCCRFVIGYSEACTIHGDVCILSAMGTAAQVKGIAHPIVSNTLPMLEQPQQTLVAGASSSPSTPLKKEFSNGSNANAVLTLPTSSSALSLDLATIQASQDGQVDSSPHMLPSSVANKLTSPTELLTMESPVSNTNSNGNNAQRLAPSPLTLPSKYGSHGHSTNISNSVSSTPAVMATSAMSSTGSAALNTRLTGLVKKTHKGQCGASHVPYNHNTAPFAFMRLVPCLLCRRKWVPETILSTTELPVDLLVRGKGRLLEAKVCRVRRASTGEADAVKISEILPFLEYDVQRQIVLKLKVLGMNAAFGYSCKVHVSGEIVVATAYCTAVYLEALPPPVTVQIGRNALTVTGNNASSTVLTAAQSSVNQSTPHMIEEDARLSSMQKQIEQLMQSNRETLFLGDSSETGATPISKKLALEEEKNENDESASVHSSASTASSSSSSSSSSDDEDSSSGDSSSLESPSSGSDTDESLRSDGELDTDNKSMDSTLQSRVRSNTLESKRSEYSLENRLTSRRSTVRGSARSSAKESVRSQISTATRAVVRKKMKKAIHQDERQPYILEVDEETDADLNAVLRDFSVPNGYDMVNLSQVPGAGNFSSGYGRLVTILRRGKFMDVKAEGKLLRNGIYLSTTLNNLFQEGYLRLCSTVKAMTPCQILHLTEDVNIIEDGQIEILLTAMVQRVTTVEDFQKSIRQRVLSLTNGTELPVEYQDSFRKGQTIWVAPKTEAQYADNTAASSHRFSSAGATRGVPSRSPSLDFTHSDKVVMPNRNRDNSLSSAEGASGDHEGSFMPEEDPSFPLRGLHRLHTIDEIHHSGEGEGLQPSVSAIAHHNSLQSVTSTAMTGSAVATTTGGSPNPALRAARSATLASAQSATSMASLRSDTLSSIPAGTSEANLNGPEPKLFFVTDVVSRGLTLSPSQTMSTSLHGSQRRNAPAHPALLSQAILSPLPSISGTRVKKYLGPLQLHFIKDAWTARNEGSLESHFYLLLSEVNAVTRAHVMSLGGNALLCHKLVPQEAGGRTAARNQGFNLFCVSGDVVQLEFSIDFSTSSSNDASDMYTMADAGVDV